MKDDQRKHDERLDELLEHVRDVELPEALAADTKRALAEARAEARLDRLLERVPAPAVPAGLSARMLAGLAHERRARPRTTGRRLGVLLVAAAIVFAVGVFFTLRRDGEPREHTTELARTPDHELLYALDALENWELLTSEDVDLLLVGLDVADITLLELAAEEEEPTDGSGAPVDREIKKG